MVKRTISERQKWRHDQFWNVFKDINNLPFLHELLDWFPNGSLGNGCLKQILIKLIDKQADDWPLYQKLCSFQDDDSKTGYLNEILRLAIEKNLFKLIECLIQSNKITLDDDTILLVLGTKNKKAADLFFQHALLDVNRTSVDKLSIAERCLSLSLATKEERESQQEILDMLLAYGVDLNVPMIKENPQGNSVSLLGYLVFHALNVSNNPDFYALQLQKFTALFFDLPGTSMSHGTLCVHPYMLDVFAHWNFVIYIVKNCRTCQGSLCLKTRLLNSILLMGHTTQHCPINAIKMVSLLFSPCIFNMRF